MSIFVRCKGFSKNNIFKKFFGSLSNSNIVYQKKIDNARNSTLNVRNSNLNMMFQTIWCNFLHTTILNESCNNNDFPQVDLDYTNYSDNSYIIFQKDEMFFDYKNDLNWVKEIDRENIELVIPDKENNLSMISRIPQEFSLCLETSKNIIINNTGDSKLQGNVSVKFFSVENKFNLFESRRIRSMDFSILCENGNLNFIIKSSLEVERLKMISAFLLLKIKKLGIVNTGLIKAQIAEIDIRSVYNNSQSDFLIIECERGVIELGNYQGNLKIKSKEAKIIIDSLDCKECEIYTENSEISIFFNSLEKHSNITSTNGNVTLFINADKSNCFNILYKEKNKYLMKSNENNENAIIVSSENEPKIVSISSWDYIKEKIERKIRNKGNKL